jgi:hypothetical protein
MRSTHNSFRKTFILVAKRWQQGVQDIGPTVVRLPNLREEIVTDLKLASLDPGLFFLAKANLLSI